MLEFKDVELNDRQWMDEILRSTQRDAAEYSFTTTYIWRHIYHYKVSRIENYLIILSDMKHPTYFFPMGSGPIKPVLDEMIADAKGRGSALMLNAVLPEAKAELEALYPDKFEFALERNSADYVYSAQSLTTLVGKKLSGKRNHINRFLENNPEWAYEPLTEKNMDEAREMDDAWCRQAGCTDDDGLRQETCAVLQAFKHFFDLKMDGGLLRAGGKVVAFSMGDPLSETTYHVHFEKAFAEVQGAYPMINKQFVIHNCENYLYVNREDDAGDEGLRKAKLSYVPLRLIEKYSAKYIK